MVRRMEERIICDACDGPGMATPKPSVLIFENTRLNYDVCEHCRGKLIQALKRFIPRLDPKMLAEPGIVEEAPRFDGRGRRMAPRRECPICQRVLDSRNMSKHIRSRHQAETKIEVAQ